MITYKKAATGWKRRWPRGAIFLAPESRVRKMPVATELIVAVRLHDRNAAF